jgi:hypothetical protein
MFHLFKQLPDLRLFETHVSFAQAPRLRHKQQSFHFAHLVFYFRDRFFAALDATVWDLVAKYLVAPEALELSE